MEDKVLDAGSLEYVYGLAIEYGLNFVGALVILIAGWVASRWIGKAVYRGLQKRQTVDITLVKFFSSIVSWVILLVAVLAALEMFGVTTTSFVALIGAAGLAVGLAFQGTLSNFASGVMLLIFRPFRVGDAVKVAGETGKIDEIGLFMTMLDTFDNRRIIIPNGKIFGSVIETITFHERRRVDVPVGTDYPADIDEVRAVLESAAGQIEGRLEDPAPQVILIELGASSINWEVRVWSPTTDFAAVKQRTIRTIKKELDRAGIGIPFPQMDVHLDGAVIERADA